MAKTTIIVQLDNRTMEKYYEISEGVKDEINSLNKTLANEFPRLILQINRRTDGYSLKLSGTNDDVIGFIERLEESGIVLKSIRLRHCRQQNPCVIAGFGAVKKVGPPAIVGVVRGKCQAH